MQQYKENKNVFKYCLKRLRRVQCLRPTRLRDSLVGHPAASSRTSWQQHYNYMLSL